LGSKKLVLAFQLVGMGWYVGGCIIGGALLGRWIASLFTFPNAGVIFILLGILLGLLSAAVGIFKLVSLLLNSD
jgi:hypothetical protein